MNLSGEFNPLCTVAQRAKIVENVHKPPLGTLADARVKKGDGMSLVEKSVLGRCAGKSEEIQMVSALVFTSILLVDI